MSETYKLINARLPIPLVPTSNFNDYKVTSDGLVPVDPRMRSRRACYGPVDTEPVREEVERARVYLSANWVPAKTANRGSYGLKHRVERFELTKGYCSNGALIQAAIQLGFRVEPDRSGINASVYLKAKRVPR